MRKIKGLEYIIVALLCAVVFISIYGMRILNPTYTDWLMSGGDLTQHYLGWKAYRLSAWHFPVGMVDVLAYPNRTSIIFTDSIPVFALIFKVLSPILPAEFQYFGLWGLLCFVLQGVLSARIIKNFTNNKFAVILVGVFFAYTPVMIHRMYYHTALAAQWILLLGLEPLFAYDKYDKNKKLFLLVAGIGALSASIHLYYVLMSGIVLLGICFEDILKNKSIKKTIGLLSIYLLVVLTVVAFFGGFASGMSAMYEGLGIYSFNLNGFINPQGWSSLFGDLPLYLFGQDEGFGYFGAGGFVLLIIAIYLFIRKENLKLFFVKYYCVVIPIIFISIISFAVAISPDITFGDHIIASMHLPEIAIKAWSVFRASGRVIWVMLYIIQTCFCILVCKLGKNRVVVFIFLGTLILQIYDIHGMLIKKHSRFSERKEFVSLLTEQNFWNALADNEEIKHIIYYSSSIDKKFMYSLTDWALNNGLTVNNFYFARPIDDLANESAQNALSDLSNDNIFIFTDSDRASCPQYNLHYYAMDGVVIGCKNAVSGFDELNDSDFVVSDAEK